MAKNDKLSIFMCYILRHNPDVVGLTSMDIHGWVSTKELIKGINANGKYKVNLELLKEIVDTDSKGRYRFKDNFSKIKACQGHSIPWVIPEMEYKEPLEVLYHGTTQEALNLIRSSGAIKKMSRHAVHMQADEENAWKSACRWKTKPVVLKIDAKKMYQDGYEFGETENNVWCTEQVPFEYVCEVLYMRY